MSDDLLEELISDIKTGKSSKIRVVYLAKPKIALDSYLKKVYLKGSDFQKESTMRIPLYIIFWQIVQKR